MQVRLSKRDSFFASILFFYANDSQTLITNFTKTYKLIHMKKKIKFIGLLLCSLTLLNPGTSFAGNEKSEVTTQTRQASTRLHADKLIARIYEINALDKSELSAGERSQLKSEVRSIRDELKKSSGGGIYISGTLLVIIIILIILL